MEPPESASVWKKIQAKLGLNIPIVLLMFKYALPRAWFPTTDGVPLHSI
jgi:hypothetical protein